MQAILQILKKTGGWHPGLYLKIDNLPYMELVIEATGESGPQGLPAISVAHYGKQNGDAMRDPEMCFELGFHDGPTLDPYYYRNDYVGLEQWSRAIVHESYVHLTPVHEQHRRFARVWDNNLRQQGFAEAFDPQKHLRGETPFPPGAEKVQPLHNLRAQPRPRRAHMQNSSQFQAMLYKTNGKPSVLWRLSSQETRGVRDARRSLDRRCYGHRESARRCRLFTTATFRRLFL